MPADSVTVDREALLDLLAECHAVADVMEAIAGACPAAVTEGLINKAERISHKLLGKPVDGPNWQDGGELYVGPATDVWREGERRASEFFRGAAREAVTADAS